MDQDILVWAKLEILENSKKWPKLLEAFICECPIEEFPSLPGGNVTENGNQTFPDITVINYKTFEIL